MKLRVLAPVCAFGVIAILVILLTAGEAISQSRAQQLHLDRADAMSQITQRTATAIAHEDVAALTRYLERFHDVYGEDVIAVDSSGAPIAKAGTFVASRESLAGALRGVPQWPIDAVYPWSADTAVAAEPVLIDGVAPDGAIALAVTLKPAKRDVLSGWAATSAAGLALLALILIAAFWWTRWVVRPVLDLDTATQELAAGAPSRGLRPSGPPELRRLTHSFTRMSERVDHALEQQRALVADASHQLRNPLAAIRLRIDALIPAPAQDDEAALSVGEVHAIEQDLDRLERIVERLLTLAEAEHRSGTAAAGRSDPARTPDAEPHGTPTSELSGETFIAPHRVALQDAGITVHATADSHSVTFAEADLVEIASILAENAVKYAPGTELHVSVTSVNARVELAVRDTGAGLASHEAKLVGTRFWRSATHADLPGTGLGHAIISELVRAGGGHVAVDGSHGFQTTITLPRSTASEPHADGSRP